MEGRLDATRAALRSPFPWIAFSAALALTVAAWLALERDRLGDARELFERRAENAATALRTHVVLYEQVLRSAAAYVASSQGVTREDWRRFVGYQQAGRRFGGLRAIGYADRDAAGPAFDPDSEPLRRAVLDMAAGATGPEVTERVLLPAEAGRGPGAGVFMYAPVPKPEGSGYVFGAVRMEELARALLDEGVLRFVDMRIYDEARGGSGQAELVDTRAQFGAAAGPPLFERVMHFPVPGRSWTIHFVSRADFDAAYRAERPWIVAFGGTLASAVVFLLTTGLVQAWNRARGLSMRDPLTGLYNRRYHDETMPRELARARRALHPVGVVAMDIDDFKRLNDSYGHEAGDYVLTRTGELLRNATRAGDIACRFGGEEFALILPGASLEATRVRAEAIRAEFAAARFVHEGREIGPFTLSAGVASLSPAALDWAAALRAADRALYAAKQAGRNRVLASTDPGVSC